MKFKILLVICIIEAVIIIMLGIKITEDSSKRVRTIIADITSPDNSKNLVFTGSGTSYPVGFSKVEVYAAYKNNDEWFGRGYFTFYVNNKGGISKENLTIKWIEEGALIYVEASDQQDVVYRIYWNDLIKTPKGMKNF